MPVEPRGVSAPERIRSRRIVGGAGAALLVVVAVAVLVAAMTAPADGPRNMGADGIRIGADLHAVPTKALAAGEPAMQLTAADGAVDVRVYVDYRCVHCARFDDVNGALLADLADEGAIVLEIHPLGWLGADSVVAGNAAACVADLAPNAYLAYHRDLLEHAGQHLDAEQLTALATDSGAPPTRQVASCIGDGEFDHWVRDTTRRARTQAIDGLGSPVLAAPTVLIDGEQYTGPLDDPDAFAAALDKHLAPAA
ncbi:DsbA family protein [Arenivirga flava]|uniref:Thioredoxin-like fold domain-containing protein n=1 Tax=Arenivirga flava TaxID=1930060 RepID=A0AA37UII1_9MICO|nr:thioredoxin domain-containing protein [Arenivirga flava]GMA29584.1 hypothetical protein GCM10025874_28370 [Arenivirga flava]